MVYLVGIWAEVRGAVVDGEEDAAEQSRGCELQAREGGERNAKRFWIWERGQK